MIVGEAQTRQRGHQIVAQPKLAVKFVRCEIDDLDASDVVDAPKSPVKLLLFNKRYCKDVLGRGGMSPLSWLAFNPNMEMLVFAKLGTVPVSLRVYELITFSSLPIDWRENMFVRVKSIVTSLRIMHAHHQTIIFFVIIWQ